MTANRSILLMRHAHAGAAEPGRGDAARELSVRGRAEASRISRWLLEHGMIPDAAIVSTARRAQQTAEIVLSGLGYSSPIEDSEGLYLAEAHDYFSIFSEVSHGSHCLLVVAHNPALSELSFLLSGEHFSMPTAAIARLEFNLRSLSEVDASSGGRLRKILAPTG